MRRERTQRAVRHFHQPDHRTWDQEVRSLLGVPAVGEGGDGLLYRVVYKPSFHADCCLTIGEPEASTGAAPVRFLSQGTNLWYRRTFEMTRDAEGWPEDEPEPAAPANRMEEAAGADRQQVQAFLDSIPVDFPAPAVADGVMIDGMNVQVEWFRRNAPDVFARSWGSDDPATWGVATAVLRLANGCLRGPSVLAVLQDIEEYIR